MTIIVSWCRHFVDNTADLATYTYSWNDAATEIYTGYGPGRMFSQDLARKWRYRTMQQLATEHSEATAAS